MAKRVVERARLSLRSRRANSKAKASRMFDDPDMTPDAQKRINE